MRRVLVVDDESELREVIACDLERRGLSVAQAANGQQALAALAEESFDVVVSDVQLPVMGGLELLASIKATKPEVPVILMSGGFRLTVEEARARGALALFEKAVDYGEIAGLVTRVAAQGGVEPVH